MQLLQVRVSVIRVDADCAVSLIQKGRGRSRIYWMDGCVLKWVVLDKMGAHDASILSHPLCKYLPTSISSIVSFMREERTSTVASSISSLRTAKEDKRSEPISFLQQSSLRYIVLQARALVQVADGFGTAGIPSTNPDCTTGSKARPCLRQRIHVYRFGPCAVFGRDGVASYTCQARAETFVCLLFEIQVRSDGGKEGKKHHLDPGKRRNRRDKRMAGLTAENVGLGIGLATAAGACTVIGSILVFFVDFANRRFLSGSLGFSSGVMIYLSFVELLASESTDSFEEAGVSETNAFIFATLCFFGGSIATFFMDHLVHFMMADKREMHEVIADHTAEQQKTVAQMCSSAKIDDPVQVRQGCPLQLDTQTADEFVHDILHPPTEPEDVESGYPEHDVERLAYLYQQKQGTKETEGLKEESRPLRRTAVITAIAIALHNFPEGLAVFFSTVADGKIGGALAVAIAIHNIPEGISIALPVYYASKSKFWAIMWCFWAGMAEPVGALIGWIILAVADESNLALGIMFGLVAGIMVYIAIQELFVTALAFDSKNKLAGYMCFLGMATIALSLILFRL